MRKIILTTLLLIPSTAFADRLGSLKNNAQVLLSTQTYSVYPATSTSSFPYGLSASTGVYSSTITAGAVGIGMAGSPTQIFEVYSEDGTQQFYINKNSTYSNDGFTSNIFRASTNSTMQFGNQLITSVNEYVNVGLGTQSQTSGTNATLSIKPIYNQTSGTASNTDLKINRTETAVGSGYQYLINAGTGGGIFVSKFCVSSAGNVGIGTGTPSAILHLKAGSASANSAPLKLTSGTLLATPEPGTLEYLSTTFYIRGSDNLNVAGVVTAGAGLTTVSKTLAQINALAPHSLGQIVYCEDCTNTTICISTHSTQAGSWSSPSAKGTHCN